MVLPHYGFWNIQDMGNVVTDMLHKWTSSWESFWWQRYARPPFFHFSGEVRRCCISFERQPKCAQTSDTGLLFEREPHGDALRLSTADSARYNIWWSGK